MNLEELYEELINEIDATPTNMTGTTDRLTRMSGRDYAYKGDAVTRITRTDKMKLLREKDPQAVKQTMEQAFKMIIAAANGTSVQSFVVNKINVFRRQMFQKLDQEIERLKK